MISDGTQHNLAWLIVTIELRTGVNSDCTSVEIHARLRGLRCKWGIQVLGTAGVETHPCRMANGVGAAAGATGDGGAAHDRAHNVPLCVGLDDLRTAPWEKWDARSSPSECCASPTSCQHERRELTVLR